MRYFAALVGWFTASALMLAVLALPAQEAKKDEKKEEKKDEPEKKDPEKKETKKVTTPREKMPVFGTKFSARIKKMSADSAREFFIEVPYPDPAKQAAFQQWVTQQMAQVRSGGGNPQQYQQRMAQFQQQMVQKKNDLVSMKEVEYHATESCKVRSSFVPMEYDDKGNIKKWTPKEVAALRANSDLPGYPSDFQALKPGQVVTLFTAKAAPAPKTAVSAKKKDEAVLGPSEPSKGNEVVLIMIEKDSPR